MQDLAMQALALRLRGNELIIPSANNSNGDVCSPDMHACGEA
jgi:hypothetical protein